MSKAFVKESEDDDEEPEVPAPAWTGKNYITPAGFARLKAELKKLVELERPEVVKTVAWAAALGDRSENADYIYGKKRLREIDRRGRLPLQRPGAAAGVQSAWGGIARRVRFLIKRLEAAEVVQSAGRETDQVFFGATVRYKWKDEEREVT